MPQNGDQDWERFKRRLVFWAGLIGLFLYLAISTVLNRFQFEWVLAFLAMVGVSIAQSIDKR